MPCLRIWLRLDGDEEAEDVDGGNDDVDGGDGDDDNEDDEDDEDDDMDGGDAPRLLFRWGGGRQVFDCKHLHSEDHQL